MAASFFIEVKGDLWNKRFCVNYLVVEEFQKEVHII